MAPPSSTRPKPTETEGALVPATSPAPTAIMPGGVAEDVAAVLEQISVVGDLSLLPPAMRVRYYAELCHSLGLNPLTKPFDFVNLNGKLTLYAKKDAAEQLRVLRGVSIDHVERELDTATDLYHVRVIGHDRSGRADQAEGIVSVAGLRGEALANAKMKAETKGKRRFTLSITGLGMLDETEIADTPGAEVVTVDPETGEVRDYPTGLEAARERSAARRARVASRRRAPDQQQAQAPAEPAPAQDPGEKPGATPAPAADTPDELDRATAETMKVALERGLITTGSDPWEQLDAIATEATGTPPDNLTAAEWGTLRQRIASGDFPLDDPQ